MTLHFRGRNEKFNAQRICLWSFRNICVFIKTHRSHLKQRWVRLVPTWMDGREKPMQLRRLFSSVFALNKGSSDLNMCSVCKPTECRHKYLKCIRTSGDDEANAVNTHFRTMSETHKYRYLTDGSALKFRIIKKIKVYEFRKRVRYKHSIIVCINYLL